MSLPSQSCWSDPLLYRYLFWKAEKVGLLFSNPKSCQYFSFCFIWNKCYIKSHQGRKKRKRKSNPLIKRHIIAIVPFSVFSQATSVNMIPPFLSKLTDTEKKSPDKREKTKNTLEKEKKRKKKKKTSTTNTVAVVVKICGLREEKKKKKTPTATVQEVFLEQGAVRAVWILSAMTVRGAAGCSASAFVRPLALQNVASWLISGPKDVRWASSTLARRKNKGRHDASGHTYSCTRIRIHSHFTL